MTLGRTEAGAIKIKTDGDAGLRAVSCGCCASGPCNGCADLIGSSSSIAWQVNFNANPCEGGANSLSGLIDSRVCAVDIFGEQCLKSVSPAQDWLCVYLSGPQYCPEFFNYSVSCTVIIGKFKKITEPVDDYYGYFGVPAREFLEPDETAECAYWVSLQVAFAEGSGGEIEILNRKGITGPILPENIFGTHSVYTVAAVANVDRPADAPPQSTYSYTIGLSSQITFT